MRASTRTRGAGSGAGAWEEAFLGDGAYVEVGGGEVLFAWGEAEAADSPGKSGASFYVPDFFLGDARPWRIFPRHEVVRAGEVIWRLGQAAIPGIEWNVPSEEVFCLSVERALAMIARGEIKKAVPTAALTSRGEVDAASRAGLVSGSLLRGEGGLAYGFWQKEEGIVGVTPESLFRRLGCGFHIDAVAGTGVGGEGWVPSPKDRLEHALVLRMHPTPALGISPRGDWRRVCRGLDDGERWRHGAPFGFRLGGGGREGCLVALRCLQWRAGVGLQVRAGCGVVRGSHPAAEYQELLAKFSAVRQTLGA